MLAGREQRQGRGGRCAGARPGGGRCEKRFYRRRLRPEGIGPAADSTRGARGDPDEASGEAGVAARYDAEHEQSQTGFFSPADCQGSPIRAYDIPDYLGTAADIRIDRQNPGYMRAPHRPASPSAFESAVDELAHKLALDPVAFQIADDTRVGARTGSPLSPPWCWKGWMSILPVWISRSARPPLATSP